MSATVVLEFHYTLAVWLGLGTEFIWLSLGKLHGLRKKNPVT